MHGTLFLVNDSKRLRANPPPLISRWLSLRIGSRVSSNLCHFNSLNCLPYFSSISGDGIYRNAALLNWLSTLTNCHLLVKIITWNANLISLLIFRITYRRNSYLCDFLCGDEFLQTSWKILDIVYRWWTNLEYEYAFLFLNVKITSSAYIWWFFIVRIGPEKWYEIGTIHLSDFRHFSVVD